MVDHKPPDLTNEELRAQVERAGLRLVPKDALDIELLDKRLDNLTTEARESHAATLATRGDIKQLVDDMKLLLEIRGEIGKIWKRVTDLEAAGPTVSSRVAYLENAKVAHAETLMSHEQDITGLHKRIAIVEEITTKKPPKIPRALARRKKAKKKK